MKKWGIVFLAIATVVLIGCSGNLDNEYSTVESEKTEEYYSEHQSKEENNDRDQNLTKETEQNEVKAGVEWANFEYDDKNNNFVGIFEDGNKYCVGAYGHYDNIYVMYFDCYCICKRPQELGLSVSYVGYIGDEEYSYIVENGKIVKDTINEKIDHFKIPDEFSGKASEMIVQTENLYSKYGIGETTDTSEEIQESEQITLGQQNALKQAKRYLDLAGFSYQGMIEQLEYEQYTHEEAVYAADNCGADWKKEAVKKAKSYLDLTSFSKQGLIDQLKYVKFTDEEAQYAAEQVGY